MVKIKGICFGCKKEFYSTFRSNRKNQARFCSIECKGGIKKGESGRSLCETCKKEFNWYRGEKATIPRICSNECRKGIVKTWMSPHGFTWEGLSNEQINYQLRICFEERIIKTDTCWIWKGSKISRGYGSFHSDGYGKRISAHRLSWKLHKGEIPKGLVIRHKCNNPICVNPDHLLLGTLKDNSRDRIEAGNSCKGIKNTKSKLNEKQVTEIKNSLKLGEKGIAKKYGISRSTICSIKQNRTWNHVKIE